MDAADRAGDAEFQGGRPVDVLQLVVRGGAHGAGGDGRDVHGGRGDGRGDAEAEEERHGDGAEAHAEAAVDELGYEARGDGREDGGREQHAGLPRIRMATE